MSAGRPPILTIAEREQIRAELAETRRLRKLHRTRSVGKTYAEIAAKWGISTDLVGDLWRGKAYITVNPREAA